MEGDFDREIVKISKIFRLIYANLYFVAGSLFESCRVSKFPILFFFFFSILQSQRVTLFY